MARLEAQASFHSNLKANNHRIVCLARSLRQVETSSVPQEVKQDRLDLAAESVVNKVHSSLNLLRTLSAAKHLP